MNLMTAQLIITMRRELAKQFARDKAAVDVKALLAPLSTLRFLSKPSYSVRVTVDDTEVPVLKRLLGRQFIVEPDYVMHVLSPERTDRQRARRPTGVNRAAGTQARQRPASTS
jgi:hypothetical protein